jgi:hypothetical protein
MQKHVMPGEPKVLGLTKIFTPFVPCAYYIPPLRIVIVARKDCSNTSDWINTLCEMHWVNCRPWYAPWKKKKKYVGFQVYIPPPIAFREDEPAVTDVLDRVALFAEAEGIPLPFGQYRKLFYRLARGLTVSIPK